MGGDGFMDKRERAREFKTRYRIWKQEGLKSYGYFPVFNSFKGTHLRNISGGALKLYIYLGLHSRNLTGECWPKEDTIAAFFDKDSRTVRLWMRELDQRGLLQRIQFSFNGPTYSFLLPYTHGELIDHETRPTASLDTEASAQKPRRENG